MRLARLLLVAVLATGTPALAEDVELADPKPDWDNPRRIMLQLTESDPGKVNGVLHNAINLQKFYGQDNVKVAVIAYAAGVRGLLKDSSPVAERVASLRDYGVEFVACGNTLDTIGKTKDDLLPGVEMVQTGIAEIVERKLKGWVYIVP